MRLYHPILWLSDLLEPFFPQYKTVKYMSFQNGHSWGIDKRRSVFFYRPLCHLKSVKYPPDNISVSNEILTYPTEEAAESEIDRLFFGYGPVTGRLWEDDTMLEEYYGTDRT